MASNYEQLVKALRYCGNFAEREGCAESCEYFNDMDCPNRIMSDAAAAIEALQKRLVNALTALHLANEKMGYYGIQPYTEADGEDMISDWVKTLVHEELKQQLPKRGKWVGVNPMVDSVQCSVCGGQLFSAELETPYCPYCGAKMEVQE